MEDCQLSCSKCESIVLPTNVQHISAGTPKRAPPDVQELLKQASGADWAGDSTDTQRQQEPTSSAPAAHLRQYRSQQGPQLSHPGGGPSMKLPINHLLGHPRRLPLPKTRRNGTQSPTKSLLLGGLWRQGNMRSAWGSVASARTPPLEQAMPAEVLRTTARWAEGCPSPAPAVQGPAMPTWRPWVGQCCSHAYEIFTVLLSLNVIEL